MAILDEFQRIVGGGTPNDTEHPSSIEKGEAPVASNIGPGDDKNATAGSLEITRESEGHEKETPSEDAQNGVRKMEAVTLAWSKKSLAGVLILYVPALLRMPTSYVLHR